MALPMQLFASDETPFEGDDCRDCNPVGLPLQWQISVTIPDVVAEVDRNAAMRVRDNIEVRSLDGSLTPAQLDDFADLAAERRRATSPDSPASRRASSASSSICRRASTSRTRIRTIPARSHHEARVFIDSERVAHHTAPYLHELVHAVVGDGGAMWLEEGFASWVASSVAIEVRRLLRAGAEPGERSRRCAGPRRPRARSRRRHGRGMVRQTMRPISRSASAAASTSSPTRSRSTSATRSARAAWCASIARTTSTPSSASPASPSTNGARAGWPASANRRGAGRRGGGAVRKFIQLPPSTELANRSCVSLAGDDPTHDLDRHLRLAGAGHGGRTRDNLNPSTIGFAYLIVVLLISVRGGLLIGTVSSVLATLCYNFFFFPPLYTLTIEQPANWFALAAFLVASVTVNRLVVAARVQAEKAEQRGRELETLYAERERSWRRTPTCRRCAKANRSKTSLLRAISHDLTTPITAVTIRTESIRRRAGTDSELIEDVAAIAEETARLRRRIDNLLAMARLEAGKAKPHREPTPPADLFRATRENLPIVFSARPITVHVDADCPDANVDPSLALEILVNLVENAHRVSPAGAPIELVARTPSARSRQTAHRNPRPRSRPSARRRRRGRQRRRRDQRRRATRPRAGNRAQPRRRERRQHRPRAAPRRRHDRAHRSSGGGAAERSSA